MPTYLRHGVHLCFVDDGAIFLDLTANAYLGIDAATQRALRSSLAGAEPTLVEANPHSEAGPPDLVAALIERGLLTHSPSSGRAFCPLIVSMTQAVPFGTGRADVHVGVTHLVRFLWALLRASMLIRRGQLNRLTRALTQRKAALALRLPKPSLQDPIVLVHTVRRLAAFFYSAKDACLLDSLVLAEFLLRFGHRPTVVLAVRTKPFLAHAWVQLGTQVLNDSLEHAHTLTPIAAF